MANFDINKLVMESVMDLEEATKNPSEERATRVVTTDKDESNRPEAKILASGEKPGEGGGGTVPSEQKEGFIEKAAEYAKENPGKASGAAAAALGAGLGGVALARKLRNRRK
ncbi:MAG: hypothetical protein ACOCV8_01775 [Spirochaetota bacterium]